MIERGASRHSEPDSSISRGDHDAEGSAWVAAVSNWEAALATPDHERAEIRLRWFLDAATQATHTMPRRGMSPVVIAGAGSGVIGTCLVVVAGEIGNPWRDAFAAIAWILFLVAGGAGVLFAFQHRSGSRRGLDSASLRRARDLAKQMDAASATMPTGPRTPP
jgi:hypothetical protein